MESGLAEYLVAGADRMSEDSASHLGALARQVEVEELLPQGQLIIGGEALFWEFVERRRRRRRETAGSLITTDRRKRRWASCATRWVKSEARQGTYRWDGRWGTWKYTCWTGRWRWWPRAY